MGACTGIQSSLRRVYSRFYRTKLSVDFPVKSSANTVIRTNQTVGLRSFNSTKDSTNSALNPWGNCADGGLGEYLAGNASITSTQDGDVVVRQHDNIYVDTGVTLTPSVRCKGLFLYCKGDLILNGNISMTARGAYADPTAGSGDSGAVSATGLKFIRAAINPSASAFTASDLIGCGTPAVSVENGRGVPTQFLKAYITERQGAGGGGGGSSCSGGSSGGAGSTGTNQTGGGGGGPAWKGGGGNTPSACAYGGAGSYGSCFSGGAGGGGAHASNYGNAGAGAGTPWGGPGGNGAGGDGADGGAGNPGGSGAGAGGGSGQSGTGGLLCIFVAGNIIGSGNLTAAGMKGGDGRGGGASGGGRVIFLYAGNNMWTGSATAAGGPTSGFVPNGFGGVGGDGAVNTEKILV